ncbi:MAG: (2Fe-2S)-binding protein [Thermomicrobiales bacterium]
MPTYQLNVNGKSQSVTVNDGGTPLLWVLRDNLGLTGTKYGCGIEVCGACTVIIDGQAEHSCVFDVSSAAGKKITTIEGLSANRSHPLQQAWIAQQVPQCGYCQSGMIMSGAAQMMQGHTAASEILGEMQNLCVCGTYQRIRTAVQSVGK